MTLDSLRELDALTVEVISDNVSDTYVTKKPLSRHQNSTT